MERSMLKIRTSDKITQSIKGIRQGTDTRQSKATDTVNYPC